MKKMVNIVRVRLIGLGDQVSEAKIQGRFSLKNQGNSRALRFLKAFSGLKEQRIPIAITKGQRFSCDDHRRPKFRPEGRPPQAKNCKKVRFKPTFSSILTNKSGH